MNYIDPTDIREHLQLVEGGAGAPIQASPFVWIEGSDIPPRQWLYGRHLLRKFVSCTIAPGGLGKSSLTMVEALAMVTGRPLLGESLPEGPLRVWLWNGEDPLEETQRRIAAACMHHRLCAADLGDRLFMDSGRDQPIKLASMDGQVARLHDEALKQLEETIRARALDVVVLDPFVDVHGVPESDNDSINAVVKALARIADRTACAFEIVHHIRKPGAGQVGETTVDDARGASALIGAVRSARVLNGMTAAEAEKAGIDNRLQFFNVGNGKANLAPRSGLARWRRIISVDLGNSTADRPSDEIGVVTAWELPGAFDGITGEHVRQVQAAVHRGEWREDVRSPQWVGRAVGAALALDNESDPDRARIRELVRVWIENGLLLIDERADEKTRKVRKYVVVGEWVTPDEDF